MKDADAKVAVFKAVLKGYFFQHKDIQKLYSLPTDAPMKDGKYVDAGLELIRKGREEAFELFWKNLNYNTMMNGDGTPVRQTMADFANDFLMGKPISFLGIGNDNFVKIEAGDQQKIMYKHFLDYNLGKKEFIEPYTGSSAAKTTTNYEPELDAKYDIASTVKPKSGGFWNKIVKAFTGHSSAKWAAYDAHLKKESIAAAKKTAREYLKNNKHKVELGDKKKMISADPLNKDTVEATFIMARNKMATVDFLNNTYIPVKEHEQKYSDAFKAVKPEPAEEAKKEEAIEEAELDDDFKPQKTQKEIEKEQLLAKKKAGEMLQASANKIISQIDRNYEKDKTQKYIDLKSSFKDTSKLVASFMNMTKFASDPELMPLKAEKIADHLTNMYLAGKLLSLKGGPDARADNNENEFGVICEDLKSKDHPLFNKIRDSFLLKDTENGLSMAEKFYKNPPSLATILNQDGLQEFVKQTDQRTEELIKNTATKNFERALKDWNVPDRKEKTNSNPSL